MKRMILLIDDDVEFLKDFTLYTQKDYEVISTADCDEGLTYVRMQNPDVVLLDYKLTEECNGLNVLSKIKQIDPDMPVIMITNYPHVEIAVEAMRLGAVHYTEKTANLSELKAVIDQQIKTLPWRRLYREEQERKFGTMIGNSQAMQEIRKKIKQFASVDLPVLIQGESGTGKELVAHAIHRQSHRASHAICTINCSTLAPQLFESEFFGHEKGAFTGAFARKIGKIELAPNGTLFLDEIGDLPLESQAKILEAIEYKRFYRLGGTQCLTADVRIIAATNKNLKECVKKGLFREDLFYRLEVLTIKIPPLRERPEDIPELIQHYLELACKEIKRPVPRIPKSIMDYWMSYSWPGNVRELKSKMMSIALQTEGDTVSLKHVDQKVSKIFTNKFYQDLFDLPYQQARKKLLDCFLTDYVSKVLERNNNNICKAAEEMGVHRSTIHRALSKRKQGDG